MNNGKEEDKEIAKHCHTGKSLTFAIEFEKSFPEDDSEDPFLVKNVKFIPSSKSVESLLWISNKKPIELPVYQQNSVVEYINNCW